MSLDLIQGSEEWLKIRLGKVTASRVSDVIAKTKSGYSASRANYMAELIAERLTGEAAPRFTNAAMEWGTATEGEARNAYSFMRNCDVTQVGFVHHPAINMAGASPDGLVGDDGLLEIKCPNTSTHIDVFMADQAPTKYIPQMQWQMACTGRAWCDFVSYDPRMPAHLRLYKTRVERDDALIASIEKEVTAFLTELDAKIAALNATAERLAA